MQGSYIALRYTWTEWADGVVATRIEPDGSMQPRIVDTTRQSDRRYGSLAARAVSVSVPYRPATGIAVYHIRVVGSVVMATEGALGRSLTW